MKLKNVATLAAIAAGVGYLFGSESGRAQMERARRRADSLLSDPRVQHQVGDLADKVKDNAGRIPSPVVADAVKAAADRVQTKVAENSDTTTEGPASTA